MLQTNERPPSANEKNGLTYARQRPQRTGPASPKSTSGTAPSAGGVSASGWITTPNGKALAAMFSWVVMSWLTESRMKRGEQLPSSSTTKPEVAGGGTCPTLARVWKRFASWSASGRGICAGSIRFDDELRPLSSPAIG